MGYKLKGVEIRLFQGLSVIALSFSVLFQYLIIKAFLSTPKWKITLDFNAAGEGFLEMLIVFPVCVIVSAICFLKARRMG